MMDGITSNLGKKWFSEHKIRGNGRPMEGYQLMIQDVSATVDAMGYYDDKECVYKTNSDTVECLRELIRVLRKDGSMFPILRHLGALNIVEKDLIPIVKGYCLEDSNLAEFTIRLLVTLTHPALVFFKERTPENPTERKIFIQINSFLRLYKIAFAKDVKVWTVLCKMILRIAKKEHVDQTEEERILLERILILIRNIVHVPRDPFLEYGADDDELVSEDMIDSFKQAGILDALIYLCSQSDTLPYCFHLLEIISSILREQSAEYLATSESRYDHGKGMRMTCVSSMESAELQELKEHEKLVKGFAKSSRFKRFKESTYVVKNVKSLGEGDLIYHKTIDDPKNISLDCDKKATRKAKNRTPMQDEVSFRSSRMGINFRRPSIKVRRHLKDFCSNFICNCYNSLMAFVKGALENRHAQENDETYYFWAAYFFMEFNRFSKMDPSFIEETFNADYFHYLHTIIENHLDMISTPRLDKENVKAWSRRLHTTLRAYKELLFTIASINPTNQERLVEHSSEISEKLFYEMEYRELLLNLICGYNEMKMSSQFLKDLIETNHIFIKMIENYSKSNENFYVKGKKRRQRKKKTSTKKKHVNSLESVELTWTEIVSDLMEAIQGNLELPTPENDPNVIAYDAISEKSRDDQKSEVKARIYKLLKEEKNPTIALALYRNAREAFIDDQDNVFGTPDFSPEEELSALHEFFISNSGVGLEEEESEVNQEPPPEEEGEKEDEEYGDHLGNLKNESLCREQKFDFTAFIIKYAQSKVVKAYSAALRAFEFNPDSLNHSIIKMFYRVAWDCKCPTFFFQLSLFRIFQRSFELSKIDRNNTKFTELQEFARYIVRQFVKMAKGNDKLLVELLFWKTKREVAEIEENYIKPGPKPKEPRKRKGKKGKKGDLTVADHDSDVSDRELQDLLESAKQHGQSQDLSDDSGDGYQPQLRNVTTNPDRRKAPEILSFGGRRKRTAPDLDDHDSLLADARETLEQAERDAQEIFPDFSQDIENFQEMIDDSLDTIGGALSDDEEESITIKRKKKVASLNEEDHGDEDVEEIKNANTRIRKIPHLDESDEEDVQRTEPADAVDREDLNFNAHGLEQSGMTSQADANTSEYRENNLDPQSIPMNGQEINEGSVTATRKRKKCLIKDSDEENPGAEHIEEPVNNVMRKSVLHLNGSDQKNLKEDGPNNTVEKENLGSNNVGLFENEMPGQIDASTIGKNGSDGIDKSSILRDDIDQEAYEENVQLTKKRKKYLEENSDEDNF